MSALIKGGRVVTAADDYVADVFVEDEAVTLIGESLDNLYEGTEVTGAPEVVLVRGRVIVEGGELVGQPGDGRFVKRARFGEQLTAAAGAAA